MNPLDLGWLGLMIAILVYWFLAISWWLMRKRQKAGAPEPASVTHVSETEIVVTFEDRINVVRAGVVLLGPPSLLLLVWLLGRN
jgi:heme/copper-type cytochrome/quinol oxidase subunit 2